MWCHPHAAREKPEVRESKYLAQGYTTWKVWAEVSPGGEASLLPLSNWKLSWRSVFPRKSMGTWDALWNSIPGNLWCGLTLLLAQKRGDLTGLSEIWFFWCQAWETGASHLVFSTPAWWYPVQAVVVIWIMPLITGFVLHCLWQMNAH